ncbi:hypothetical protein HPB50_025080 [Hyalomma asiaticum]|uniref:Uncharacterized protein n=1 Tax=Hyalomma asiaticum TaxID=266040 RepID=A0ACB7SPV5_HYAAI|nr:hypothetical protein HPB50_025080 [Hyalomma asiaticum]
MAAHVFCICVGCTAKTRNRFLVWSKCRFRSAKPTVTSRKIQGFQHCQAFRSAWIRHVYPKLFEFIDTEPPARYAEVLQEKQHCCVSRTRSTSRTVRTLSGRPLRRDSVAPRRSRRGVVRLGGDPSGGNARALQLVKRAVSPPPPRVAILFQNPLSAVRDCTLSGRSSPLPGFPIRDSSWFAKTSK